MPSSLHPGATPWLVTLLISQIFKAQRPQQGTWPTSSPAQAIWVPLVIHMLSEVTEVVLIPFSSLKTGLLHATHDGYQRSSWCPSWSWKQVMRSGKSRQILFPGRRGNMKYRAYLHFCSDLEQNWYLSALPRATSGERFLASGSFSGVWRFSLVLHTPGLFPNNQLLKLASVTWFVFLLVYLSLFLSCFLKFLFGSHKSSSWRYFLHLAYFQEMFRLR